MDIELKLAYEETEYVRRLIEEYMQMLVRMEPDIETYLRMQNSEEELRNLKEKYKKPDGRLYLAYVEGMPVGCIGLRIPPDGWVTACAKAPSLVISSRPSLSLSKRPTGYRRAGMSLTKSITVLRPSSSLAVVT